MTDRETGKDAIAILDEAWAEEKRPLQTKCRWGGYNDPTLRDVIQLSCGGIAFLVLAIAYALFAPGSRNESQLTVSLYVLGFALVSVTYFILAAGVNKRLKLFRIAKADYLRKRESLENMIKP
ncbi:MAG: hypothetical protein P1U68_00380 [Verrucomicrobiales bacterium]|nr:hypothetical protein [Verrucomicrobiales bacterium]